MQLLISNYLILLLVYEFNFIRPNNGDSIENFILTTRASAHLLVHSRNNSSLNEDAYAKGSTLETNRNCQARSRIP